MSIRSKIQNVLTLRFGGRTLRAGAPEIMQDDDGLLIRNRQGRDGAGYGVSQIPVAYACINVMTETMSRLPKWVATRDDPRDDYWEPDPAHPVSMLLQNPSRYFDAWQFWDWYFRCRFLYGNAYAWVRREAGVAVELVPAYINRNNILDYDADRYHVRLWDEKRNAFEKEMIVMRRDLLALHGPGYDGYVSPSPVAAAAERALSTIDAVLQHNETALRRGQFLKQVLTTDVTLAELPSDKRAQLKEDLRKSYTGAVNAGKVPVLPPGFSVTAMSGMSAVDLQLIEVMRWSALDLCRVWNVPPRMVYASDVRTAARVGIASIEADAESFVRWTVVPEAERVMAQLSAKLLTDADRMEGRCVRVTTDRIGVGSWTERVNAADTAVAKAGVLTPNEARARLGYPPHDDGDRLLSPTGAPTQGAAADDAPPEDMDGDDEEDMNNGNVPYNQG